MRSPNEPKGLDEWKATQMVKQDLLDRYHPRNAPDYEEMLELIHWSGMQAEAIEFPESSIAVEQTIFGPFDKNWSTDEIVKYLNDDAKNPETCRFCLGDGWTDGRPRTVGSVPRRPCESCAEGRKVQAKQRTKKEAEKATKRDYLQRELARLAVEYEHVEQQLMELDR